MNLIGKIVNIKGRPGDWGRVLDFDGEYYHVAFCDDKDNVLIFTRDEISVQKIKEGQAVFSPLRSEIKKAVRAAEKKTGLCCEATGFTYKPESDPLLEDQFVEFQFEVCSKHTGHFVATVFLQAFLPDRRRSWVTCVID